MPGTLRTQRNIALSNLLRPYPQYSTLNETLRGGIRNRYRSLQLQFQRPFVNGFNFVIGYNYNNSRNEEFYDVLDNYTNTLTWQPADNSRHRLTGAFIFEVPYGRGRRFGTDANRAIQGILGGWSASTLFTYSSGEYLRFGGMLAEGNPKLDNPTRERWFDTSLFARLPAFTRRTNPLQYGGVTGPRYVSTDATLAKEFNLVAERLKFELRAEAYNLFNSFIGSAPSTNVTAATFGQITAQRNGWFGRQIQFSGRLIW
jgi:hypothetical protein